MAKHSLLIITLILAVVGITTAQDTIRYHQANARLFGNQYTFIRSSKSDRTGIFTQQVVTDDLLEWFGKGTFKETRRKIFLTFDTTRQYNRTEFKNSIHQNDSILVYWFDWWGNSQLYFSVRVSGTNDTSVFTANDHPGVVRIPRKLVQGKELVLYPDFGNVSLVKVNNAAGANEIRVFANTPNRMYLFDKTEETLAKRKAGFVTTGMWNRGKRTIFVRLTPGLSSK